MPTDEERSFLDDVTRLRDSMLAFAKKMLREHGEFFPFARAIDASGGLVSFGVAPDGDSQPRAAEVYDRLLNALKTAAKQGRTRAVGLCSNVNNKLDRNTSAMRLVLEHNSGAAFEVVVPYKSIAPGSFEFLPETFKQLPAAVF
jgi:hypothetical protein